MTVCHRLGDSMYMLAIAAAILLSGHFASAADLSEVEKRSAAGGAVMPPVASQGGAKSELSRSDLVEALEELSNKRLGGGGGGDAGGRADKSTSESMFDGSGRDASAGSADKPTAAGRPGDSELLRHLASLADRILHGKSDSSSSAAGGGGDAEQRPRPADQLSALLATLGGGGGGVRDEERRFFSNAGGRGKKEEVEPASTDRLYEAVRELTGFVHDLVVLYREEKEETAKTFSTITQIIEKLVSYHAQ